MYGELRSVDESLEAHICARQIWFRRDPLAVGELQYCKRQNIQHLLGPATARENINGAFVHNASVRTKGVNTSHCFKGFQEALCEFSILCNIANHKFERLPKFI